MGKALHVIDVQNDYFPGGKFPLWNTEETLAHTVGAVQQARAKGVPGGSGHSSRSPVKTRSVSTEMQWRPLGRHLN